MAVISVTSPSIESSFWSNLLVSGKGYPSCAPSVLCTGWISGVRLFGETALLKIVRLKEYPLSRPPGDTDPPGDVPGESLAFHCGTGPVLDLCNALSRASLLRGDGALCNGAPGLSEAGVLVAGRVFVVAGGLFALDGESPSAFASVALPFMVHRHQRMCDSCLAMDDKF